MFTYHHYDHYNDTNVRNEWACRKNLKDLEKEMARFPHRRQLVGQIQNARQALKAAEKLSRGY